MAQYKQFADILGLGTPELIIILIILLVLFGGSKLPQLARSVGTSMKELRKGVQDDDPKETTAKPKKPKADKRA